MGEGPSANHSRHRIFNRIEYLKTINELLKTKLFNNLLKYQLLFQQNKYKIVKKMSSGILMYFKLFKICEEFGFDI